MRSAQIPEQDVARPVVDGSLPDRELPELLDGCLDPGALVMKAGLALLLGGT